MIPAQNFSGAENFSAPLLDGRMTMNRRIPEILAPAGDRECLAAALRYGADAVYVGGKQFGMRASAANFDAQGLKEAADTAHQAGAKLYVTCNTLPHEGELERLPEFLQLVQAAGADALIVADLGVMALAQRYAPRCDLHVSVQLGAVNSAAVRRLGELGAARVVLSRELSLGDIARIREKNPDGPELECFVHGSQCLSVSGRCLLSHVLTGRDANRGDCAQPCRWRYHLTEEKRPGRYFPVEETQDGSYILDANDLCMIEHGAALAQAGVTSLKIEGRAKAAFYVAGTVNAYRMAVDGYAASGCSPEYHPPEWVREETEKVSHRPYGTGFYFGIPGQNVRAGGYVRPYEVAAVSEEWRDGRLRVSQRNRFFRGDVLEILVPGKKPLSLPVSSLWSENGEELETANHAQMTVWLPCAEPVASGLFLRRRIAEVTP